MQHLDDVTSHALGSRSGERKDRDVWETSSHSLKRAVFRAEIVPPRRNTVSFIDRNEFKFELLKGIEHPVEHESFGREVEDLNFSSMELSPRVL